MPRCARSRARGTRSIDLGGAMVLPGFNDAHTHFGNAVEWHFQAMLMYVEDEAAMLAALREATARVPKGMWITGGDWGQVAAGRAARQGKEGYVAFTPSLKAIDAVSPDHPGALPAPRPRVLHQLRGHEGAALRQGEFRSGDGTLRARRGRANSTACSTARWAS